MNGTAIAFAAFGSLLGLPAGVDRVTGVGVVAYHTNNIALNLMYIDKVWFGRAATSR